LVLKREEVTSGWRKLHSEEHNICTLHKIREDEMGRLCSTYRKVTCAYKIVVGGTQTETITVFARSRAWVLTAWILGSNTT
jgi:hypothetical protein